MTPPKLKELIIINHINSPRDPITLSEDEKGVSNHLRNAKYWIPRVDTVPSKMQSSCSICFIGVGSFVPFPEHYFFDIRPGSKRGNRCMLTQGDCGSH